jgi:alpha-beta hydrolase superfamily lysophospholipase
MTLPSTFVARDGVRLVTRVEAPSTPPRGVVILIHGLSEHTGLRSWTGACQAIVSAGFVVTGFDLRGHGRSPGRRGHVDRWEVLRDDLMRFRAEAAARWPGLPLFLVGLSLGALVVLDSAMAEPLGIAGVVAVAAPVGDVGVSPMARLLARLASGVWPAMPVKLDIDLAHMSRDLAEADACVHDPLFHQYATARGVVEGLSAIAHVRSHAAALRVPCLLLHGAADVIARPEPAFFEAIGASDKTCRLYPGAHHNLFIETNRAEVFADLANWILARS